MAPDLNSLQNYATDGYESSKASQESRYTIPDVVLGSPTTRKIKVISIGAGVTGIMNAYYIQKLSENVEHVIYDRNKDIGGTWLENRYPGKTSDPTPFLRTDLYRLRLRHPLPRLHIPIRSQCKYPKPPRPFTFTDCHIARLATLFLLCTGYLEVPRQGV